MYTELLKLTKGDFVKCVFNCIVYDFNIFGEMTIEFTSTTVYLCYYTNEYYCCIQFPISCHEILVW